MDQQGRAHQVAREPRDDLHGIVLLGDLDEPGIGTAWPSELGLTCFQPEHKDLGLNRPRNAPGRVGSSVRTQIGFAMASTCSRVAFML
jgi:hypothetical protein